MFCVGLLTACEDENGNETGIYGPMDPTKNSTYEFLEVFFDEITKTFPEKYLHIGGDEVDLSSCWSTNRKLNEWLQEYDMPSDYKGLEALYIQQLQILLSRKSIKKQVSESNIFKSRGTKLLPILGVHTAFTIEYISRKSGGASYLYV